MLLKFLTGLLGFGSIAGVVGAGWFIFHLIQHQTQLENDLKAAKAQAALAQAQASLNTTAAAQTAAVATKTQTIVNNTREIEHNVETSPGSDALVDPRSASAFVVGLCSQAWRSGDPACRADDPAGQLSAYPMPAPDNSTEAAGF